LPDHLSSNDIFFFKHREYPIYSKPFLMRRPSNNEITSRHVKPSLPPFFNTALWSLGILLIELILGTNIESLRTHEDDPSDNSPSGTEEEYSLPNNYFTAYRLLGRVRMVSSNYGTAVIRCLEGDLQNGSYSVGSPGFCQDMYSGIIALLETDFGNA
jgi:hypothetical protein